MILRGVITLQQAFDITGRRLMEKEVAERTVAETKIEFLDSIDVLVKRIIEYVKKELPDPESRKGVAVVYDNTADPISALLVGDKECAYRLLQDLRRDGSLQKSIHSVSIEDCADALAVCDGWFSHPPTTACVVIRFY